MFHSLLIIIVKLTIFSLMLATGINLSLEKMLSFWRQPVLLLRALLAVVVLVPLGFVCIVKLFNLSSEVATALALLAASLGSPLITKRAQMTGARFSYAASLQLTLALLAVVITPITLAIGDLIFERISYKVTILEVARQVTMVQFLPVILGLILQQFATKYINIIIKPLNIIVNILFLLLVIFACMIGFPLLFRVWGLPIVAIMLILIISLGIGHILGGKDDYKRPILAISCIARNVGLALFIAILNDVQYVVIPTLVAYVILGTLLGIPYSIWNKRKLAKLTPLN